MPQDSQSILATDLDGTLIPLAGHDRNRSDLQILARDIEATGIELVYVTGRHFSSVQDAMKLHRLPLPAWIISDVGTTMMRRNSSGQFEELSAYADHQAEIVQQMTIPELQTHLADVQGLRLQESEKQGRFKLSYYVDSAMLEQTTEAIQQVLHEIKAPYSMISSVDPFNDDGLIDLLPSTISKAGALAWWAHYTKYSPDRIVFAGDSGNDFAALTWGCQAIVVGNADRSLAERVEAAHTAAGWTDRLYLAKESATSGVLEGCRAFGLLGQHHRTG